VVISQGGVLLAKRAGTMQFCKFVIKTPGAGNLVTFEIFSSDLLRQDEI
jgi:hypothetical protein